MNHNLFRKSVICLAIGFFIIALNSNVFGGSISIKWGKGSESDNPPVAKNLKSKAHRHMHRLMVIGQNINTGTILLVRFITIPAEVSIFI